MANCVCDIYHDYATFHTAVELVDDTKLLAAFPFNEGSETRFVIVHKT